MIEKIIGVVISFVVSGLLTYCVGIVKQNKNKLDERLKNENMQNIALRTLLKNQLTNIYFVYSKLKEIPDYAYQNFLDMLKVYESLDGDGFIHKIAKKMETWEIIQTDILK